MYVEDKVVVITGGGSGLGKGMAIKYAKEGWKVVIAGRTAERLEQAKNEIEQFEGQVVTVQMDVRNPEQVDYMVKKTKEHFGQIDVLINNAAGNFIARAEDLSVNGWNSVIDIVLNGTWFCTQAVGKEWIATGKKGSIINIVATYAWNGGAPGVVHSAAAKAGVLSMSQTLAAEWGRSYGIRVNCIAPGGIEGTEGIGRLAATEERRKQAISKIPLGRLGRVEEIAEVAYFLSSKQAAYINGECMNVDAGANLAKSNFLNE